MRNFIELFVGETLKVYLQKSLDLISFIIICGRFGAGGGNEVDS